jgi:hypothetical protein
MNSAIGRKFCFQVTEEGQSDLLMQAASEEEMQLWMNCIKVNIERLMKLDSFTSLTSLSGNSGTGSIMDVAYSFPIAVQMHGWGYISFTFGVAGSFVNSTNAKAPTWFKYYLLLWENTALYYFINREQAYNFCTGLPSVRSLEGRIDITKCKVQEAIDESFPESLQALILKGSGQSVTFLPFDDYSKWQELVTLRRSTSRTTPRARSASPSVITAPSPLSASVSHEDLARSPSFSVASPIGGLAPIHSQFTFTTSPGAATPGTFVHSLPQLLEVNEEFESTRSLRATSTASNNGGTPGHASLRTRDSISSRLSSGENIHALCFSNAVDDSVVLDRKVKKQSLKSSAVKRESWSGTATTEKKM